MSKAADLVAYEAERRARLAAAPYRPFFRPVDPVGPRFRRPESTGEKMIVVPAELPPVAPAGHPF